MSRTRPSRHTFTPDVSDPKTCATCGRREPAHSADLEQYRRTLADTEATDPYRKPDVYTIPTCPDCGAPLGIARTTGRGNVGTIRCGPCTRARKARRKADRRRTA